MTETTQPPEPRLGRYEPGRSSSLGADPGSASQQGPTESWTERHRSALELFKYPMLVGSIFFALWGAKLLLGIEFAGAVSSVGADGIKFVQRTQDASERLVRLEKDLETARLAISELQTRTSGLSPQAVGDSLRATEQHRAEELLQVSPQQANLTRTVTPDAKPLAQGKEGWIWIGNYDAGTHHWTKPKANDATGRTLPDDVAQIDRGVELIVAANLVLRDGAPDEGPKYFTGRLSTGVVPTGTRVSLLEPPRAYDRGYTVQYWAKVRVMD